MTIAEILVKNNVPLENQGEYLVTTCPFCQKTSGGWQVATLQIDSKSESAECNNCLKNVTQVELLEAFGIKARPAKQEEFPGSNRSLREKATSQALLTCLADIQPEPISWLWPERIALGKLTLIAGDPGLGKSLLTATLAAIVSKGYPWPIEGSHAPVGDVVLLSAEDDPADTIRPRLDAAGADCTRIHILRSVQETDATGNTAQRMFSLKSDINTLEKILTSLPNCRLLVIDPVSAYLAGSDSNNNSDIRGLLAPIAELAARYKVAAVSISHLNKSGVGNALYRTMGSLAFTAAARAAYIVTKDKNNPERRLLMPAKNNVAKDNTGLAYSVITGENGAPVVVWEPEPLTITADEALITPESGDEQTDTDWATEYLKDLLSSGPVTASEVQKAARQIGVSKKALRRAQEKLGIKPQKTGFKGGWVWALPTWREDSQDAPSIQKGNLDTLGI